MPSSEFTSGGWYFERSCPEAAAARNFSSLKRGTVSWSRAAKRSSVSPSGNVTFSNVIGGGVSSTSMTSPIDERSRSS